MSLRDIPPSRAGCSWFDWFFGNQRRGIKPAGYTQADLEAHRLKVAKQEQEKEARRGQGSNRKKGRAA